MTIPGFPPFVPADPATYLADEAAGKTPIEGFEFFSEGTFYRYTSAAIEITLNGDTFYPEPILRETVRQGLDLSGEELQIQIGNHADVISAFKNTPYGVPFYLRVYREHTGVVSPTVVVIWEGEISDLKVSGGIATFTITNIRQSSNRTVPRYTHQSICNHQLYGALCGTALRSAFEETDTVVSFGAERFPYVELAVVGTHPAGYFIGGVVTWTDPDGHIRKRFIMDDRLSQNLVYLLSPFPSSFEMGDTVTIVPGCDRKYATCRDKFSNTVNFGGFPWSKTRDPSKGVN